MQRNRENNRVQKTRDPFKKIADTKGNFFVKMGTIKDRNDKKNSKTKQKQCCFFLGFKIP